MSEETMFRDEATEMLLKIENSLIAAEGKELNKDEYLRVFRILHSLKGSCQMCGYECLAPLLHETENLFKKCESKTITSDLVDPLLSLIDKCREAMS